MAKTKKPAKETKKPTKAEKKPKTQKSKTPAKQDTISLDELMGQLGVVASDDQLNESGHNDCCQCSSCADDGAFPAVLYDVRGKDFYGPFLNAKQVHDWLDSEGSEDDDLIFFTLVAPARIKQEWAMEDLENLEEIDGFQEKVCK